MLKINTNPKKIEEVLTRGVVEILPSKAGLAKIMRQKKIRLYNGIDATSPYLHLGNAVSLLKLKQFQELGHEVIFLVGTFTAQIGDPSGHTEARKPLTLEQVKKNILAYKNQASKILDFSKVKIVYNHQWLSKLKLADLVKLASNFTVQRIIERDLFQERIKEKKPIWLNEFLYPLFQGYDSVYLNVDLEVGGNDQTFNMLCGRELQKIYNQKEKYILTTPLIPGLDGRKMSKTFGNAVNLTDPPNEMYGKLMSLKDELIIQYFELCTELPLEEIKEMEKKLEQKKINPRDLKAKLAKEIVGMYYGEEASEEAEKEFQRVFREKKLPREITEIKIKEKNVNILDLLVKTKLVSSKSEAKRLILQKGVKIDGKTESDWQKIIEIKTGKILQVGKRKFVKLIF